MDSIYYRVNHKKKLIHFDNASLAKMKSTLFYELSAKNESTIYEKILKIFNFLLNDYQNKSKDKLFLIYSLTEEYKKIKNIQIENYDKISINVCKKIIEKDFKMTFNFNSENINDICTLISLGFTKLFSSNNKKYKTYDSFLVEIQSYRELFIDFVRIYQSYNYSLPSIVPEIRKNTIPNELLLLMEIFQGIKHINLALKDYNKDNIIFYLIILLNYDWLFPFVFEIDLDLSFEQLSDEIQNIYYLKEKNVYIKNRKNNFECNSFGDNNNEDNELNNIVNINLITKDLNFYNNKIINWKLVEKEKKLRKRYNIINNNNNINNNNLENTNLVIEKDEIEENYINILNKYKDIFDIILCYYYLIRQVKYLKTLSINMPNGFIKESLDVLKMKNIPDVKVSNIFEYLTIISSLCTFNIVFNSLEKKTFEYIIYIIQNNSNLKEIKMDFFPFNCKNFTSQYLIKIAEECGICHKILSTFNKDYKDNAFLTLTYDNEKAIKQKILEKFEINLEKLFLLLQTKKLLEKIELIFNLPLILYDEEGYHWTILKFIFNVIILLQKETFNLKEFNLILPFFNLDNRQYPVIGDFLEKINLNEKNKLLKSFCLKANIFKLYNIKNLISYNLILLNIGELDLDTFKSFIDLYQAKDFLEKSQLKILSIELNKTVIKYSNCKTYLTEFISGHNPKYLVELSFKFYFRIKCKKLYDLLISGNGNKIERYNFIIRIDNYKKYQKIINHNLFYYLNNDIKKEINKYIPVLKKYNLIDNNKKNITNRILKFLVPSNKKIISITNLS